MPKSATRPAPTEQVGVRGRSKWHTAARSCIADPMRDEARARASWTAFRCATASRKCGRCSKVNPVGGAPSRSGFLATPINASSRRTFSVDDTASWEKRCRVGRLVRAFRSVRERTSKKDRCDPKGDQERDVEEPRERPAKAPCHEAVSRRMLQRMRGNAIRFPRAASTVSRRKRRPRLGRRPDRSSHTSNGRGDERIRPVT
jgi:hypothetical protein